VYGLTVEELDRIVMVLRQAHVKKAVLFGSRAKGTHKAGSDVDIAVIGDEKKISDILNEETHLPYIFDVINLETITSPNLMEHIQRVGKIIA
jgi:predicted nucleotidyltransferase